jgi:Mg-chelatase subunit ChlI
MGAGLRVTSGSKLVQTGDVAAILTDLQPGDVLFIDEIHRMDPEVEQMLYRAMEDFQLDVVLGSGPTARSIQLDLPKFTLVGATTNPGALSAPLRDRFRLQLTVELPSPDELTSLVQRIWDRAELAYEDGTARLVAERSIGIPRRARHLAFYLVRARTVRSKLHTPLTADSLSAVLPSGFVVTPSTWTTRRSTSTADRRTFTAASGKKSVADALWSSKPRSSHHAGPSLEREAIHGNKRPANGGGKYEHTELAQL